MKFTPADTYDGLLTQTRALHALNESLGKEIDFWQTKSQRLEREISSINVAAVLAERDANEKLTNALEAAEAKIAELEREP